LDAFSSRRVETVESKAMRSFVSLVFLLVVAVVAIGAPESHHALSSGAALDFRGMALLAITIVIVAVETVRRIP
jgi:hypothetical protein